MEHKHNVHDSDAHFLIDPIARTIKNTSDKKLTIMQYDHNSERFTFSMPRFVERHDMMACDRIEIHYINISADKTKQSADIYEINDISVSAENADNIVFSWLISRNATVYAGTLNFLVRFVCLDDNGAESYAWHTGVSTDFKISSGFVNNAAEIIEPYVDVLAQWKASLFGVGDTEEQRLLSVSQDQQAAIDAKGAAVLASIPAEYADLSALADDNFRRKAGAIIQTAKGEIITAHDASVFPLSALSVYGRSTQDGTPTPETPAEIDSTENPVVSVCGLNIWDEQTEFGYWQSANGVPYTADNQIRSRNFIPIIPNTKIYVTAPNKKIIDFVFYDRNKTFLLSKSIAQEITSPDDAYYMHINLRADYGTTYNHDVCVSLIPLHGAYEATAGNQTVTIPRTLRGIPVASGGNYTDENGQQWIADEIDFERGVYVQRVKSFVLTELNGETWRTWGVNYSKEGITGFYHYFTDDVLFDFVIGNIGVYGSTTWGGLNVGIGASANSKYLTVSVYNNVLDDISTNEKAIESFMNFISETSAEILAAITPIETPLSNVEITAFRALHTNKPNTTILNDSGAYMAAEYVADTKTYIDNKIAEMIGGET